jgi:hypothetical protein
MSSGRISKRERMDGVFRFTSEYDRLSLHDAELRSFACAGRLPL